LSFFPALVLLNKAFAKTKQAKRKCTALNWHSKTIRFFTLLLYSVPLLFRLGLDYLPLLELWYQQNFVDASVILVSKQK